MLSKKNREVIRSTVPVLETHGEAITTQFYQKLFASNPQLLNVFNTVNQTQGRQQTALANAVYAAAVHIDNLEEILPAVSKIAHKHRALGVLPEHYPIVGENLLAAMKEVLGDAATDEVLEAWGEAYGVIADAFIGVEHQMYQEASSQSGGWTGFREFVVDQKIVESDVITSFYLKPADNGALADFQPGQYVTVKVSAPGQTNTQLRHYSLSDVPNGSYYRISVKREAGREDQPSGIVSTSLHDHLSVGDTLLLSAPAGDFVFDSETSGPVVFLSGGVGMTPSVSMLKTALEKQPERDVTYIHAAINGSVHAMKDDFNQLADTHGQLKYHIVYERPSEEDRKRAHFSKEGFIDLSWLKSVADKDSTFYFCGPQPFMKAIYQGLREWGVSADQIRYEFFGPQGSLE